MPPMRTSSQERFNHVTTPSPLAGSPHTISISKGIPFFLHQLQNMSDDDFSRIPEDVYKRFIKEKADKIVQEVVPEPTQEVDRIMSQQNVSFQNIEISYDGFTKQRTLYPLAKVSNTVTIMYNTDTPLNLPSNTVQTLDTLRSLIYCTVVIAFYKHSELVF